MLLICPLILALSNVVRCNITNSPQLVISRSSITIPQFNATHYSEINILAININYIREIKFTFFNAAAEFSGASKDAPRCAIGQNIDFFDDSSHKLSSPNNFIK